MNKMKTRSAAKKRFKSLPSGKIKRSKAFKRHLLTKKATNRKRALRHSAYVSSADFGRISRLMPYAAA
ncbi:50S ribosomal protein L35 [Candidatus Dependentiae bacterium Noda2021]|nr:50S ribosomal protein L35 [Candidatus Dependentiae bacterium Noda2021]